MTGSEVTSRVVAVSSDFSVVSGVPGVVGWLVSGVPGVVA